MNAWADDVNSCVIDNVQYMYIHCMYWYNTVMRDLNQINNWPSILSNKPAHLPVVIYYSSISQLVTCMFAFTEEGCGSSSCLKLWCNNLWLIIRLYPITCIWHLPSVYSNNFYQGIFTNLRQVKWSSTSFFSTNFLLTKKSNCVTCKLEWYNAFLKYSTKISHK